MEFTFRTTTTRCRCSTTEPTSTPQTVKTSSQPVKRLYTSKQRSTDAQQMLEIMATHSNSSPMKASVKRATSRPTAWRSAHARTFQFTQAELIAPLLSMSRTIFNTYRLPRTCSPSFSIPSWASKPQACTTRIHSTLTPT